MSALEEAIQEAVNDAVEASSAIDDKIDNALGDYTPEVKADDVDGLEDMIDERASDRAKEVIGDYDFSDAVTSVLDDLLPDAVTQNIDVDEVALLVLDNLTFQVGLAKLVAKLVLNPSIEEK